VETLKLVERLVLLDTDAELELECEEEPLPPPQAPASVTRPQPKQAQLDAPPYRLGDAVATREAYGDALAAVGKADGLVVALDGEVSNSTFAEIFAAAEPERYFEM